MKLIGSLKSLTIFEGSLWGLSLLVIAGSFIISKSADVLTLIASLIGVTALIFVSKGLVLGQALTVVFAVFYGIISFHFRYYGEMITYLCMTAPIAAAAVISWLRHPYGDTKVVEVSRLSTRALTVLLTLSVIVTAVFYFILKALGNANLLFSTMSVTTSFIASGLTFLRSPYYAIAYSANDIILIILWSLASARDISYVPMIFCFIMFLANDLYGFYNWNRLESSQNPNKQQSR